jgi:hypothetical protein
MSWSSSAIDILDQNGGLLTFRRAAIMIVLMVCGPGLLLDPVLWVTVPKQPEPAAPAGTSISYSPA